MKMIKLLFSNNSVQLKNHLKWLFTSEKIFKTNIIIFDLEFLLQMYFILKDDHYFGFRILIYYSN